MTRIILYGCNGRMGRMITDILKDDKEAAIVAGVDKFGEPSGKFPVFASLAECDVPADVLIDFSSPAALSDILENAKERKLALVLCSTGYSDEETQRINKATEEFAVLRSANMSLGVTLLLKLVNEAAKVLLTQGYDPEIVELHHNKKLDAPSGTALAFADAINDAVDYQYANRYERHSAKEKRPVPEIGISSVRGGTIPGEHEILFCGPDEVIEFRHVAYSRALFGKGAVTAAKFLAGKEPGMYSMADVI
ncbi:MAG: 4-hydroxy-tetrahydrodipicolinate reductase [Lachnospiraceae bacterium]|nr:4-hydroxy-tetrahydrodipicolinate reductase [Lachnospiraceae bacterium]